MQDARAALYAAFAVYPRRLQIDGCPCCTNPEDQALLQKGALDQMPPELIADFAFSAMLTWGDAVDVKHFLPRILELAAEAEHPFIGLEFWIIKDRIERAGWAEWSAEERGATGAFLCSVASDRYVDSLMQCIVELGVSVTPILDAWTKNPVPFIEFTNAFSADLMQKGHLPWAEVPARAEVEAWLQDKQRLVALEALFAAHINTPDANVIAQAIDALTWLHSQHLDTVRQAPQP